MPENLQAVTKMVSLVIKWRKIYQVYPVHWDKNEIIDIFMTVALMHFEGVVPDMVL